MAPTAPKLAFNCSEGVDGDKEEDEEDEGKDDRLMSSPKDSTRLWAAPALMMRKWPRRLGKSGDGFMCRGQRGKDGGLVRSRVASRVRGESES
jgi:hypothetical protein